jgi:hypothetical protein
MKRPILFLAGLLAAETAFAQAPQGHYFAVHQELAKPYMIKEYEATSKEFVAMVKANKAKMPHFSFDCIVGRDFLYTYIAPMPNLAGLDGINADFGALAQSAGAAFADLMKRGGATTEVMRDGVVQLVPELSYQPAQPRLQPSEAKYRHYDIYYVLPGRETEADAVAAEYVKLFKAKNVTTGYNLFKGVLGHELPMVLVAIGAKDPVDFHTEDAKVEALLGAEGKALQAKAASLCRRFESRDGWMRPDLSVPAQ